jgi:hypothetical protein
MSLDRNRLLNNVDAINAAYVGPTWCFPATESDTNYLEHPDTTNHPNTPIVSAAISLTAVAAIKVEFWNGVVAIIPSGALQAGVRYPLHIVKVWSTGTGVTDVLIWQGESLRNLRPTTY